MYDAWARAQNGPLTRRGVSFPASADDFIAAFTGVTLALDESNVVVGYASWQRGSGHGDTSTVAVSDLLATDARAYPALWRFLGGFGSVTGKVRIETSGRDVARLSLPTVAWQVVGSELYMLRVDDVPGAFSAIPLPGAAEVAFAVTGDLLESMNGAYRLLVRDRCHGVRADGTLSTVCRPSLRAASPSPTPEPRPARTSGWPGS